MKINSKRAAMEMSVGTIVTIVLLMTVLILGLVMIRTIFKSADENIKEIDTAVKNQISKLFSEDTSKKVVVYPPKREIAVKKGETGGFGFSIRNNEPDTEIFSYEMVLVEKPDSCKMSDEQVMNLFVQGKTGNEIKIGSGEILEDSVLVVFSIPESASLCRVVYGLNIKRSDGSPYLPTITIALQIKAT